MVAVAVLHAADTLLAAVLDKAQTLLLADIVPTRAEPKALAWMTVAGGEWRVAGVIVVVCKCCVQLIVNLYSFDVFKPIQIGRMGRKRAWATAWRWRTSPHPH